MPFINGKFYMNPAYGRAIERARRASGIWSEELPEFAGPSLRKQNFSNDVSPSDAKLKSSGAHWVTIDGRHVLIQETPGERARMIQPGSEKERYLSIVVFNETGGLSPSAQNGNGSAENLHDARIAVAEIANRLRESGHPEQVAVGEGGIYTGLWNGLAQGNQGSLAAWNDSVSAARQTLADSNVTNAATHFRLDSRSGFTPSSAKRKMPSRTFGPFRNSGGGDASPRPHIYLYH